MKEDTPKSSPAFVLGEVTFDPSWFEALKARGVKPETLPSSREQKAYYEYLHKVQVTALPEGK